MERVKKWEVMGNVTWVVKVNLEVKGVVEMGAGEGKVGGGRCMGWGGGEEGRKGEMGRKLREEGGGRWEGRGRRIVWI